MERNLLLTIEYDGTGFSGWQRQPDRETVQGVLEEALTTVCAMPVQINGTSRTDAGVHAYGQRASFSGTFGIPTDKIAMVVNHRIAAKMSRRNAPGAVRIVKAEEKPENFHARFDAVGKKYIYKIRNAEEPDIFRRNYCYQVEMRLDPEKMKEAASHIEGTHDFACFQAAGGTPRETTVRTVFSLDIQQRDIAGQTGAQEIWIVIKGDGFLYNMVRIIAGTLVEVGLGKLPAEALPDIIRSKNRSRAGHTAPPQGLYLAEVYYNREDMNR